MEIVRNKFLMGTDIEIIINSINGENKIKKDIEESFNLFLSLEKEFSRFDKNSDLSQLNILKERIVSDRFIKVLKLSIKIFQDTNGYFNPLINISNLGYSNSFSENNFSKTNIINNLELEKIKILGNKVILLEKQNLDFGGIVKGYCVDLVQKLLEKKGYDDFIINAGGDIFISQKSTIAIDSPENNGDIFALIDLENKFLSTSGTYNRKWNIEDKEFHHILNPKLNENINEIQSISLITNKCYIGDAYATACIAMGLQKSIDFLRNNTISGIIIGTNGEIFKIGDLNKYNLDII